MGLILTISTVLNSIIVMIVLINLISARRISAQELPDIHERVSILIPLRNERANAESVIRCALQQEGLQDFEVIVLDDSSSDGTREIIGDIADSRLITINGAELPSAWLGKNFACHQLSQRASGDIFVFVDADVRLSQYAVNTSIHAMRRWRWDFISPYPRQIAVSPLERLVQPLLQWSWFATLPLRIAEVLQRRSMVVANGQFFAVTQRAYLQSGGHQKIKDEVLDDLELARTLVSSGFRGGVAEASSIASCRMYSTSGELIEGYTKSQWRAFGNILGALIAISLLALTSVLPLLLGISGANWGWINYGAIVMTRFVVGIRTRSTLSSSLLHPISAVAWIYLIIVSWYRKSRGQLLWRGRPI